MKIYGYVAAYYDHALTILDLSDPTTPTFKGSVQDKEYWIRYPHDVYVRYPYAYLVSGDSPRTDSYGLGIFDIRRPEAITLIGGLIAYPNSLDRCFRVIVDGDYAYVAGNDGLTIVDISDPTAPRTVGNWSDRRGYHVVKDGDYCFLTAVDRLCFLDVADPTNPTQVSTLADGGSPNYINNARGLYKKGNILFVAAETDYALTAWDVSNPTATPTQLGVIRGAGSPNYLPYAQLVIVRDNLAYVAVQGTTMPGLTIIDVANPKAMSYKGGVYSTSYLWQPWGKKLFRNYAYICGYAYGVTTVDISDPEAPTIQGNIQGAGSPYYLDYCHGMDIHVFGVAGNPNIDQRMFKHVERIGR